MTAAPKQTHPFLPALCAVLLASALTLGWTTSAHAAGRAALSSPAANGGGDPGKGKDKGKDNGKGKDKGKGKGKGKGGSTDDGDTGVAPTPSVPPPSTPAPSTPAPSDPAPSDPAPSDPAPPVVPPSDGPPAPNAPPPSPDPAPSPDPVAPDPSDPTPDPSDPAPAPSDPAPAPSSPDVAPRAPASPVLGATKGSGVSAPAPAAPSAPSAPKVPLPTVAALPSFRQAQPTGLGSFSPQSARAAGNDTRARLSHLLFSFKRLLHLWSGNHAGLSLRRDGVGGALAVLVTLVGRAPDFAIYTPHAIATRKAGIKYRLNTWLRTAHPGSTLCLRAQEVGADGGTVRTTERCVAAGSRWQHFRLSTKSLAGGHKLRFSVYAVDALPGDSFEVGGLTAARAKH
jgi:hypothetical protein